jgi:tyrosyl-tRNA synthetase
VRFAQEIVTRFHSKMDAESALADFEARFQKGAIPVGLLEVNVQSIAEKLPVAQLLKLAGLVASTSEALRMIEQGGVKLDGEKIADKALEIARGSTVIAQVGKRKFAKVHIV